MSNLMDRVFLVSLLLDGTLILIHAISAEKECLKILMEFVFAPNKLLMTMVRHALHVPTIYQFGTVKNVLLALQIPIMILTQRPVQFALKV
jgi:hypothetical protein